MSFQRLDIVRVARLVLEGREVDGGVAEPPRPRPGDVGTVVEELGDDLYLVERATDDGRTVWVAEFRGDELALVHPAGE